MNEWLELERHINEVKSLLGVGEEIQHPKEIALSRDQQEICDFLNKRAIRYLICAFDKKLLPVIRQTGITPKTSTVKTFGDGTMLYITKPAPTANMANVDYGSLAWAVLDAKCLYSDGATYTFYDRDPHASSAQSGNDLAALKKMFAPSLSYISQGESFQYNREDNRLLSYDPTDPTACVVTHDAIDPSAILFYWDPVDDCFIAE